MKILLGGKKRREREKGKVSEYNTETKIEEGNRK